MLNVMYKVLVNGLTLVQIYAVDTKTVKTSELITAVGWRYTTDILDQDTGEYLFGRNNRVQLEDVSKLKKHGITEINVFVTMNDDIEQHYWKTITECKVTFIHELLGDVDDLSLDNIEVYYSKAIEEYHILNS